MDKPIWVDFTFAIVNLQGLVACWANGNDIHMKWSGGVVLEFRTDNAQEALKKIKEMLQG